ncbi:MAG: PolC-type DNA polymerase III, partial [Oscillospiraceae bacterium]
MGANILDIFDKVTVMEDFAKVLERADLKKCDLNIGKKTVEIVLKNSELISTSELMNFCQMAEKNYDLEKLYIEFDYTGLPFSMEYFEGLKSRFINEYTKARMYIARCTANLDGERLTVGEITGGEEYLSECHFKEYINQKLSRELGIKAEVVLEFNVKSTEEYIKQQDEEERKIVEDVVAKNVQKSEIKTGPIFGTAIKRDPLPMVNLNDNTGVCAVIGEIIDFEVRETRKGRFGTNTIITFDMADQDWAVACKVFANTEKTQKLVANIDKKKRVMVEGKYEFDEYAKKNVITVGAVELMESREIRPDDAEVKRVELHMHTKMSQMDAVTGVGDLVERAAKWGHSAVAITDHGVAQAFPDARKAAGKAKKSGSPIKILYGLEGYLIDDVDSKLLNKIDDIKKGEYVVFDLETTGLKDEKEMITEIGAIKIVNGRFADKFSQLVNPTMEITQFVSDLTGITNNMVENMPTIDEVLPKFMKFCGEAIMVAHNAKFDMGFIRRQAKRLDIPVRNDVMDTLEMSKRLFPNEKKHKLNLVAERLGISLENHHRAVDDATATAEIFIKFMYMEKWGEAEELEKQVVIPEKDNPFVKSKKYHIILLAQNYIGLKNMYKMISASNIKYFYRKPGIPKSLLSKLRGGIIVGSACEAGELYTKIMDKREPQEIADVAKFYDYLEIQPIANNEFMVRNGRVNSDEDLQEINKKILAIGDENNRKTVATCDVHFMDSEDEVYRRVLMGAQGFADADNQAPLYLRTTNEMLEEFKYLGEKRAYEVVVENTNMIANLIEDIQPVKDGSYPPTIENCEQDLIDICHDFAHKTYGDILPKIVQERMDRELDCIEKYGYSVMYMIAHKLVKKSNEAGYLVGSRGSVGSSFAAFLSGITEVNALCPHYICPECKYSEFFEHGEYAVGMDMPDKECPNCGGKLKKDGITIPFETFLGFKGDKVPD